MNQRSKRARDRKSGQNNVGTSFLNTGGHVVSHGRGVEPIVLTPQKTTGDVPAEKTSGLAKASPFFQKLKDVLPKSKTEEKKVIAEAVEEETTKDKD